MGETPTLEPHTILYVDDEEPNLKAFERAFRFDYRILVSSSGREALEMLRNTEVHILVTDQRMPGMTGLELLQHAIALCPNAIRIILTAFTDSEVLLEAIQTGRVYDYALKPWRRETLGKTLEKASEFYRTQVEQLEGLKNRVESAEADLRTSVFGDLIGADLGLKEVTSQLLKVAPTDSTVLIRGESGTGKELIARALHENSRRRDGAFVKINASAFSPGVLESELFGHEKGAFTGALSQKKGRFEMANRGTLFLDEIGDLPESIQVKLLRILQEREFERVGGTKTLKVDVRLIAATHRPLELLMEEGKFRQDLFYRINVIPLEVPPLRERRDDIAILSEHFLRHFNRELGKKTRFSSEAMTALQEYPWPGNVRELKNILERAVVLADSEEVLRASSLNLAGVREPAPETLSNWRAGKNLRQQIKDQETLRMAQALERSRGNLTEASRLLGIPRTTLFSRLKKLGMA